MTSEEFGISIKQFGKSVKKVIEMYLTPQEIKELNNPKTKSKRKKELIKISDERLMKEGFINEKNKM